MRCLVVDQHPVAREGARALIEKHLPGAIVECVAEASEALAVRPAPDVVIIDPWRLDTSFRPQIPAIAQMGAPVVVLTSNGGTPLLEEALSAGALGYVRKDSSPNDLIRAIRSACAGETYIDPALSADVIPGEGELRLSARQSEILQLLADGLQTDHVAESLGLSTETVRTHSKRILSRLGARTRTQAVAIGLRAGIIR